MRDDVALPETSLHRRLLVGIAMTTLGAVVLALGLFTDVPRAGWFVGGGILLMLLGIAAASPVIARPFLLLARSVYARLFGTVGNLAGQNTLRNPRRTAATASALMIGLALACTMAIVGDSVARPVSLRGRSGLERRKRPHQRFSCLQIIQRDADRRRLRRRYRRLPAFRPPRMPAEPARGAARKVRGSWDGAGARR
jgi:hypothetical protein